MNYFNNLLGGAPLTVAAKNGSTDLVKLLLDNGADRGLRTGLGKNKKTAIMLAEENGHTEVAKLLRGERKRDVRRAAKSVGDKNSSSQPVKGDKRYLLKPYVSLLVWAY